MIGEFVMSEEQRRENEGNIIDDEFFYNQPHKVIAHRKARVASGMFLSGLALCGLGLPMLGAPAMVAGGTTFAFTEGKEIATELIDSLKTQLIFAKLDKVIGEANKLFAADYENKGIHFYFKGIAEGNRLVCMATLFGKDIGVIDSHTYRETLAGKMHMTEVEAFSIYKFLSAALRREFASMLKSPKLAQKGFEANLDRLEKVYVDVGGYQYKEKANLTFEEFWEDWDLLCELSSESKQELYQDLMNLEEERQNHILAAIACGRIKSLHQLTTFVHGEEQLDNDDIRSRRGI